MYQFQPWCELGVQLSPLKVQDLIAATQVTAAFIAKRLFLHLRVHRYYRYHKAKAYRQGYRTSYVVEIRALVGHTGVICIVISSTVNTSTPRGCTGPCSCVTHVIQLDSINLVAHGLPSLTLSQLEAEKYFARLFSVGIRHNSKHKILPWNSVLVTPDSG